VNCNREDQRTAQRVRVSREATFGKHAYERTEDKNKDMNTHQRPSGENQTGLGKQPEDLSEVMDFSSYDLRTTIRLIVLSGESRRVDVKKGTLNGSIFVREGDVYRAVTGEREGDEAFFEILSWKKAVHIDSQEAGPTEKNVKISTQVLLDLMDAKASSTE
jgi:uncharacterized protein (UPF0548 family)